MDEVADDLSVNQHHFRIRPRKLVVTAGRLLLPSGFRRLDPTDNEQTSGAAVCCCACPDLPDLFAILPFEHGAAYRFQSFSVFKELKDLACRRPMPTRWKKSMRCCILDCLTGNDVLLYMPFAAGLRVGFYLAELSHVIAFSQILRGLLRLG